MTAISVGCQTYTWEMLGPAWKGRATDLRDWIAAAGYAGIEITSAMIGEFAGRPRPFAQALEQRGLRLAAHTYSSPHGFSDPAFRAEALGEARQALEFAAAFPQPRLSLGGAASTASDRRAALDEAISLYNEVGRLAAPLGVSVAVHPHSHHSSLLETAEEYAYLMARLDPAVSYCPDTGHIVRGGQDLLTCLRTYLPRITHVHLKDANAARQWVGLGEGVCDFAAVLSLLESAGYRGWVVAEEESEAARHDGIAAITRNRAYLRSLGY